MFGFQRRRVRRFEWETLFPKLGPLPQISHTDAMGNPSLLIGSRRSGSRAGRLFGEHGAQISLRRYGNANPRKIQQKTELFQGPSNWGWREWRNG
jgi:hypothetical protein